MPKRYGNLYPKIISIDNIKLAHQNAKKDKSFYRAVKNTSEHLDERAKSIEKMLKNHSYKVSPYRTSVIQDKNKKRILYKLPYYPDRIIQWAIMLQIEPIFKESFTNFTCASVPKRGIHKASKMLYRYINVYPEETKYCLKFDIKKFYPSINRSILKQMLRRKIKDNDLLIELDKIIDSMEQCDISNLDIPDEEKQYYMRPGKGLPVGSYLSQYLANFYLTPLDHLLKEVIKCPFVIRYMDDIVILAKTKDILWNIFYKIKEFLKNKLDLDIKANYQVFPVDCRGIDFVGYRHFRSYKLLRKCTLKSCKDTAKKMLVYNQLKKVPNEKEWCAWVSSIGWLSWCDSFKFYIKYYMDSIPIVNTFYNLFKKGKKKSLSYQFLVPFSKIKIQKTYYNHINYHNCIHQLKEA